MMISNMFIDQLAASLRGEEVKVIIKMMMKTRAEMTPLGMMMVAQDPKTDDQEGTPGLEATKTRLTPHDPGKTAPHKGMRGPTIPPARAGTLTVRMRGTAGPRAVTPLQTARVRSPIACTSCPTLRQGFPLGRRPPLWQSQLLYQ